MLILDVMLAVLFALPSFFHAGTLHAWLGFRQNADQNAWPKRLNIDPAWFCLNSVRPECAVGV